MLPLAGLLAILLLSVTDAFPDCHYPPPPPSALPSLINCLATVSAISELSRVEGYVPRTWARYPPAFLGVKLPATFSKMDPSNDCELFVDTIEDGDVDVFSMFRIARVAKDIVHYCLIGAGPETSTVGNETIWPLRVINVGLRKRTPALEFSEGRAKGTEFDVNGTKVLLQEDTVIGSLE